MKSEYNDNLLEQIENMDDTAQRILWKGLANSSNFQLIRQLEYATLDAQRMQRQASVEDKEGDEFAILMSSLDERNEKDLEESYEETAPVGLEREEVPSAIELAKTYAGFAELCADRAHKVGLTRWDSPMSFEQMLRFRLDNYGNQALNPSLAFDQMSAFIAVDKATFLKAMELEKEASKEKFKTMLPDIVTLYQAIRPQEGYFLSWDELPVLNQHRLAIKTLDILMKEWTRILKRPTLEGLATLGMLNSTVLFIEGWIDWFEREHDEALSQLIMERGINLVSVKDVHGRYPLVQLKQ